MYMVLLAHRLYLPVWSRDIRIPETPLSMATTITVQSKILRELESKYSYVTETVTRFTS